MVLHFRQTFFDNLPHNLMINTEITVNEFIPHPCHFGPWQFRMSMSHSGRDLLGGFPDNLKLSDYRAGCLVVFHELFVSQAFYE